MIKKKLIVFFIILISLLIFARRPFFAQELTPTPKSSVSSIIKYDLAYPGTLPDHPLYKLKVLRDKISLALISNPVKKIEFYLLQADKGVLATGILVEKNKISIAEQTALKAENNITLISNNLITYYTQQRPNLSDPTTKTLLQKLKKASLKHQEVINSILKKVPQNQQKTFKTVLYFSKTNMENIEKTTEDYRLSKGRFK